MELENLGAVPAQEFLADRKAVNAAKYLLIVATEACIDICNHIVAKKGGRAPSDYADCFRVLQETGLLPAELEARLEAMARFRNMLVHLYWKVGDAEV